ncbi:MAG TPA: hypothetical protein GX529_09090 [Firmicutes bacterium]|nr:hypothetical protein [Candidatus Fermentithermobacillaceae bacterium]
MTNRDIVEKLRKRIEEIQAKHSTSGKVDASLPARTSEPARGFGARDTSRVCHDIYPPVKPKVVRKQGFSIYTTTYGAGSIEWLCAAALETVSFLAACQDGTEKPGLSAGDQAVFLDIETTGLLGAGTVAFLTGFGKWKHSEFEVTQFFLDERESEENMLTEIAAEIASSAVLVTFNGKSFDVPVLQTRFIINGMANLIQGFANQRHLDLYSLVRKLGRHPLYGMSLKASVERFLGARRLDDIPGHMIPALYFMYEQDRDISVLDTVFKHNRMDILDMVGLLKAMGRMYLEGYERYEDAPALAGVGKLYMRRGDLKIARRFLQASLSNVSPSRVEGAAGHRRLLATVMRKQGDWDNAACVWKNLIGSNQAKYEDYLWLARYYEIRLGDIETSFQIVLQCIEFCRQARSCVPGPVMSRKRRLDKIISKTQVTS